MIKITNSKVKAWWSQSFQNSVPDKPLRRKIQLKLNTSGEILPVESGVNINNLNFGALGDDAATIIEILTPSTNYHPDDYAAYLYFQHSQLNSSTDDYESVIEEFELEPVIATNQGKSYISAWQLPITYELTYDRIYYTILLVIKEVGKGVIEETQTQPDVQEVFVSQEFSGVIETMTDYNSIVLCENYFDPIVYDLNNSLYKNPAKLTIDLTTKKVISTGNLGNYGDNYIQFIKIEGLAESATSCALYFDNRNGINFIAEGDVNPTEHFCRVWIPSEVTNIGGTWYVTAMLWDDAGAEFYSEPITMTVTDNFLSRVVAAENVTLDADGKIIEILDSEE